MLLGKKIKRYQRRHDYSDGELWIVSYADMMTLLFGFFVIMFSLSTIDQKNFDEVSKELAEQFKGDVSEINAKAEVGMLMQARQIRALQLLIAMLNLGDMESAVDKLEREVAKSESLEAARKAVMDGVEKDEDSVLKKLKILVKDKDDEVELALPGNMLFKSGTAELTPKAEEGLKRIARYLNRVKGLVGLEVVGHTDSAPPSKRSIFPSNWALSAARAGSVTQTLIDAGVSPEILLTRGMASLQPLFPEKKANGAWIKDNMEKNRRVSIVIKKQNNGK